MKALEEKFNQQMKKLKAEQNSRVSAGLRPRPW